MYGNDEEIRGFCLQLIAFALLSLHEVETSFYQFLSTISSGIKEKLRQLSLYFDHY